MVACDYFNGVFEYIEKILMEEDDDADNLGAFSSCIEKTFYDLLGSQAQDEAAGTGRIDGDGDSGQGHPFPGGESQGKGRRRRDDEENEDDDDQERRRKQIAAGDDDDECEPTDKYDKTLLCQKMNPCFYETSTACTGNNQDSSEDENVSRKYIKPPELKRGRPKKGSKKQSGVKEIIDFKILLSQAAKAVSVLNNGAARELLMGIRRHSSPYGDHTERLAHYFANALDARIEGTGSMLYTAAASSLSRSSQPAQILKCYQAYFQACPFQRLSNIVANKTIALYTREAQKIHIIDFGIMYGFQWPCLIQGISLKPGGPPLLKITGIDLPQAGLKPAARVERVGRWLMSYCKRFDVPFEYHPIAKKWKEIKLEDLGIEEDAVVVVNSVYQMKHVLEESMSLDLESPRDSVLNLIREIHPTIFVHGISNANHGVPLFTTRFGEALNHYSCLFDMLEATMPREDNERQVYERDILGSEIMNVVTCEGSERVERPEGYKKWQVRDNRAGFEQLPLDKQILQEAKTKVRLWYHPDFLVEEDGKWMLQGWKGRVVYALSFWKPTS